MGCVRDSAMAAMEWPHAKSRGHHLEPENTASDELQVGESPAFRFLSANFRGRRMVYLY